MMPADYLRDSEVRQWLDGVEPAWTLLTFDSLRALRREPSAVQTAIRIANDLGADEIAGSAVARNTLVLLRQATERDGLPVTATGNLSRAVVAEMCKLFEWPDHDQAAALQFNNVINEPDFLPLHVVRTLAHAPSMNKLRDLGMRESLEQRRACEAMTVRSQPFETVVSMIAWQGCSARSGPSRMRRTCPPTRSAPPERRRDRVRSPY
jgi:hypothetical protein